MIGYERPLEPDGQRGNPEAAVTITPYSDSCLLTLPIIGAEGYEDYRLDIHAPGQQSAVWRSDILSRPSNDAFSIIVPRHFLASPGTYQVVLYGVRGGAEERLATYSFAVPRA